MSGSFDPRITAYFGDAVLQAGFMPLPHLFLRHYRSLDLSQVQAMFVLQLMEIAWDIGDPPNSVNKLAARMGLSQRSIRACSKEVHDLGLIEIYDQWDEAGAQVENAYDLSPLFRRLAALAPVYSPPGQIRTRRQRTSQEDAEESTAQPIAPKPIAMERETPHGIPLHDSAPSPLQEIASPPVQDFAGEPMQKHAVPPGTYDQAPREPTITGRVQKGSELKEEIKKKPKRTTKTKQEHHGGGVQDAIGANGAEHVGTSLRSNEAICTADARLNRQILDAAGLHSMVVEQSATTLTPAECWSLVCYARGAALGPAWIASQVYDWSRRQPQAPQLNRRYDAAGSALAALPMERCQQLVDITDECCPHAPDRWRAAVAAMEQELAEDQRSAFVVARDAVWAMMGEQRHAPAAPIAPSPAPEETHPLPNDHGEVWATVLDQLQHEIGSADWRSWIAPLLLLDVEGDNAVVGAPNVFVRNEASTTYDAAITKALHQTLGRTVHVEYVIGTTVLA